MRHHRFRLSLKIALLLTLLPLLTFFTFAASGQSQIPQINKKAIPASNQAPLTFPTKEWQVIQNQAEKNLIQQAYLKADNAETGDNFGHSVAISGDTIVIGAPYEDSQGAEGYNNNAENAGAAYVFVRNEGIWEGNSFLKASICGAGDWFGYAVAISDSRIVVGAPNYDDTSNENSGAAYVFVRENEAWTQQSVLYPFNPGANDFFGSAVAISEDRIVIGAPFEDASGNNSGAAYVFGWNGTQWELEDRLVASFDQPSLGYFGNSVAISENTVVVGAPGEDSVISDSGAVYVFYKSGSTWSQQAHLKASTPGISDAFGSSVKITEDAIVIGAPYHSNYSIPRTSGAAYVFVREGDTWHQRSLLKPSNPDNDDRFGSSVAISGDRIVIGSFFEDGAATAVDGQDNNDAKDSGAAYAFVNTDSTWVQQSYLKASNSDEGDRFGWSVAISDDSTVVGAPYEESGEGAVYIFFGQSPTITSMNNTTFIVTELGNFVFEATGYPNPTILCTGDLPEGVSFDDNNNGTATLKGIPVVGSANVYELTITASNGVLPNATQLFTLTVGFINDPPSFTSTAVTEATAGQTYTYTIVASDPDVIHGDTLTITAPILPGWLNLDDQGDGTALLSGMPTSADIVDLDVKLEVSDLAGLSASQSFTITIARKGIVLLPLIFR